MQFTLRTLQEMLWQSVERFADRDCFSFVDGEPMTYAQLGQTVKEVQLLMMGLGVKPQDKVAILSQNMPNWGVVYLATASMGAVVIPLLPDFSVKEIENVLNHSGAKVVFASHRLQPKLDEVKIPNVEACISIENFFVYQSKGELAVVDKLSDYEVKPTDLAAIIYTSGTTGRSKGVMLSHRNLMAELEGIYDMEPVEEDDVFLSILPLAHTYENSLGLLTPVFRGASVYYLEKTPTPSILMPALAKIRPTYMLTVPMIIEKVFKNKVLPELTGSRLMRLLYKLRPVRILLHRVAGRKLYKAFGGRLKFFGIGGAKLDAMVERFLLDTKIFPYAIGYGLTEAAPLLAGANPRKVKHQSTGTPMLGISLRINEPNENGEGEIYAKGAPIMLGYYKEQALTSDVFTNDGWFKTGDLGAFDTQGNLYIKGRLKNVILGASGENIYPEEIEFVINNFRFVTESLVVEQKGRLVAMVRFSEELEEKIQELCANAEQYIEQLKQELIAYVNSQVSRFSQISVVVALQSDFEKTSTQKIKRFLYTNHLV
jgi:long-chain acyl-CoA synthetase